MRNYRRSYAYLCYSSLVLGSVFAFPTISVRADDVTSKETAPLSPSLTVSATSDSMTSPSKMDTLSENTGPQVTSPSSTEERSVSTGISQTAEKSDLPSASPSAVTVPSAKSVSLEEKPARSIPTTNLVQNGNFSKLHSENAASSKWSNQNAADSWKIYIDNSQTKDKTPQIEVTDGKLVINNDQDFRGAVTQTIKIDASKQYELSFDIQSEKKSGQAFVRILEKNPEANKPNRIWLSPMTSDTSSMHQVTKLYRPQLNVSEITLELYYELGKGKVIFDNISLKELGPKEDEKAKAVLYPLPDKIDCPLNQSYVFQDTSYQYLLDSNSIADISKAILVPKATGQTLIRVTDQSGTVVKTITLNVLPSTEDSYTALIKNWNDLTFGQQNFDSNDSAMNRLFEDLEKKVATYVTSINKDTNRTFLWNDLNNYSNSAQLTATYRRLEDMAKQIITPTSKFYQDADTIRLVKNSLAWLHQNVYNPNKDIEGSANWWDYEIGTPRAIVGTLTLLNKYFTQEEMIRYTDSIEHFVPDPNYFRKTLTNPFEALGGNLVDMGRVKIISGILRKDDKLIATSIQALNKLFTTVTSGNGFYADGSYIDHTNIAYTGAYGNVLIDGISQLLPIVQKTNHPIANEKVSLIYQWIDKSFLPLIVNGELMDMSRGRSVSREKGSSHAATIEVLRGMLRIANMSKDEPNLALKSKIKTILKSDSFYDPYQNLPAYSDIQNFKQLLADEDVKTQTLATWLSTFNSMDKLAYYNAEKGFAFALSLHSNRTQNYEAMNDENTRGWYTGDGMFYLYNKDQSHYSDNYWPTVNPYFLPGTTESDAKREDATKALMENYIKEKKDSKALTGQVTNSSPFVGSLKLSEKYAVAAMDFHNWNRSLEVKKGWVILDDKIVFLGSGIKSQNPSEKIYTTIEQRKVNPKTPYKVYINGQLITEKENSSQVYDNVTSILLESSDPDLNIGYVFTKPSQLIIDHKEQTGTWNDINRTSENKVSQKNTFITIRKEHGNENDDYAYYMMPKASLQSLNEANQSKCIQVLENNSHLQVVYQEATQTWAVIKYDDQVYNLNLGQSLELKEAGIYMLQKENNQFKLVSYKPSKEIAKTEVKSL